MVACTLVSAIERNKWSENIIDTKWHFDNFPSYHDATLKILSGK